MVAFLSNESGLFLKLYRSVHGSKECEAILAASWVTSRGHILVVAHTDEHTIFPFVSTMYSH